MPYRKINVYECLGTGATSTSTPIKLGLDTDIFDHTIVTGYANNLFPMETSVQRGVDQVFKLIQQNPGDFILVGTSQGALIMSQVIKEISTWPRYSDLVGAFLFGNPCREEGTAFPDAPVIASGHGIMSETYRLSETPEMVWEFANAGDPICTNGDDADSVQSTNAFQTLYESYSGAEQNLVGTSKSLWQTLKGSVSSAHSVYGLSTYKPLSGYSNVEIGGVTDNERSAQQIAIDQMNNVIGPEHSSDYSYEPSSPPEPPKRLYINATMSSTPTHFSDIASLGFNVRIPVSWNAVQPSSNKYTWTQLDSCVNSALSAGLEVMLTISPPGPTWASPINRYSSQFGAMATTMANRYKPGGAGISADNEDLGVLEYQIWNEPNVIENWSSGASGSDYYSFIRAAYIGIKSAEPSATVIFAGLQSCSDQRWRLGQTFVGMDNSAKRLTTYVNREPSGFVSEFYAAGGRNYFDVMAFHPLSIGTRQTPSPSSPTSETASQSDSVYQVMSTKGDSSKEVWWTAMGYNTANYKQLQQSDYLNTLRWLAAERSYVGGLGIYGYSD